MTKKTDRIFCAILLIAIAMMATAPLRAQDTLVLQWGRYECNGTTMDEGAPELPLWHQIVEIDEGAVPSVKVVEDEVSAGEAWRAFLPHQRSRFKNEPETPFVSDEKIFQTDAYYARPVVEVEVLGSLLGRNIARVTVAPVEYNPVSDSVRIHRRIVLQTNGFKWGRSLGDHSVARSLLLVVPSDFVEAVRPLEKWKRQMGFHVRTLVLDTADRDAIRNRIMAEFQHDAWMSPAPDYILLVGDVDRVPSFNGRNIPSGLDGHYTDLYYGETTGDYLPEAIIGRLSVADTLQLRQVVEKIVAYESGEVNSPDWLGRSVAVAGTEVQYPAMTTTNAQTSYVGQVLASLGMDTSLFSNPASADQREQILDSLRAGKGLVNYTAHCNLQGWLNPTVTASDLSELAQSGTPMVFVNNCCSSNNFYRYCFGEQLLRMPSGGAVGVIGAANETLWLEDYLWSVGAKPLVSSPIFDPMRLGAFDGLLVDTTRFLTLGEMMLRGNLAVTQYGSIYDKFYWEIYCVLGDPTVGVRTRVPLPTVLSFDSVELGTTMLVLHGSPWSRVAVTDSTSLLGSCVLDAAGEGRLLLDRPLGVAPVVLTAVAPQHQVAIDTIKAFPRRPRMLVGEVALLNGQGVQADGFEGHDTMVLRIPLTAVGEVRDHWVRLTPVGSDSSETVTLSMVDSIARVRHLSPMGDTVIELPIWVSRGGGAQMAMVRLEVGDSASYSSLLLRYGYRAGTVECLPLSVEQEGRLVRRIEHGGEYVLHVVFRSPQSGLLDSVSSHVRVLSLPDVDLLTEADGALSVALSFRVSDSATMLQVEVSYDYDGESRSFRRWILVGTGYEDFETADFSRYEWQIPAVDGWTIDTMAHGGHYSMRSGTIADGQRSRMGLKTTVLTADTIGFWVKCSTQPTSDKLVFSVDGVEKRYFSGTADWTYYKSVLQQGEHLLEWAYQKNGSVNQGLDCVWVDDVRLPFAEWVTPNGVSDTASTRIPVGIFDVEQKSPSLFPNPATDRFWIVNPTQKSIAVRISDIQGRPIDEFVVQSESAAQYNTTNLRFGVYVVEMGSAVEQLIVKP